MQGKNVSKTGSNSWLLRMVLWFDRKPEKAKLSQERGRSLDEPSSSPTGTCLYLAYGSNMCSSVFQGNRGIRPISSICVVAPQLRLCWNVEGIPYIEPCYANAERQIQYKLDSHRKATCATIRSEALVGIVYEISIADFAHVLRTEGQGYEDVEVDCFQLLSNSKEIAINPNLPSFRAHAVLAAGTNMQDRGEMQPSNRYLDLLVAGATEHGLPSEYIASLQVKSTYELSTPRLRIGKFVFSFVWFAPLFVAIMLERQMADGNGRIPRWVRYLVTNCFAGMWWTHAYFFKPVFGNGAYNSSLRLQV